MNLPELPPKLFTTYDDKLNAQDYGSSCYAKGRADAQKELLDRLTAGVEVPEAVALGTYYPQGFPEAKFGYTLTQLLEYGAAQRVLGAKEEREACAKVCETTESYSYPGSITKQECARNIRARGEA